jgi:hypothetical protein
MPKKAYLAQHFSSSELKTKYLESVIVMNGCTFMDLSNRKLEKLYGI